MARRNFRDFEAAYLHLVIEDGIANYRLVDDGRKINGKVEIRKGVEAGDEVAITSFVRLMNGKAVEVVNE